MPTNLKSDFRLVGVLIDYTSNNNYNMVINRIYIMQGDFMLLMCKNTLVYELDPDDFDEQTIIELF